MPDTLGMELDFWTTLAFVVGGILAGIINTLAGSGSLITLPIFVFICGLPASVANGTNRVGVLLQSAIGLHGFQRSKLTSFAGASWLVAPALVGAIIGSRIAVGLGERAMSNAIGVLMVVMLIFLLVKPGRWLHESVVDVNRNRHPLTMLCFFLIGVYGGFIQAGVGIFLLAGLVLVSKYTLKAANGIKLLIVLAYGIPTLVIFFVHDQVHLIYGVAMALFQGVGAWLAVRFVSRVPNAEVWIHRLLIAIVAAAAVKFFV